MADDTNATPAQLKRAKELAELIKDRANSTADLVTANSELNDILDRQLGAQRAYATEEEKRIELVRQALEHDQTMLNNQQRLVELEAIAAADRTKKQTEQLKGLKQIEKHLEGTHGSIEAAIKAQKKLVSQTKEYEDKLNKITTIQKQAEGISANRLRQAGLLADKSGDIADAFINARKEGVGFSKVIEGSAKSMSKVFTMDNMQNVLKNNLKDLGETARANFLSADGLLMQYQQLGKEFAQSTGLSQDLGEEIQSLTLSMNDQHFAMEETNRAYETLATQAKSFTDLNEAGRAALTEQALQFSRLGVTADTFAETIDNLGKAFGQTPDQINKTTEEMSNFARTLGVGPNKMLADFNKQLPLLARYGEKQGAQMFRELAVTAKRAGIEMEDLVGIAKTFDTFEGAAEAAGKLNFMLGGPMLNSVQLLNANESERIQILKDSLRQSGKSFEQMGRFEKDLIAQTLNVDAAVAQKLFSDANISSIEDATAAIQSQATEMGSLASQAEDATTIAQRQKAAQEAQLKTMEDLGPMMEDFHTLVADIQSFLAGWAPYILIGTMAIKGMYNAWVAIKTIQEVLAKRRALQSTASVAATVAETAAVATGEAAQTTAHGAADAAQTASHGAAAATQGAATASLTAANSGLAASGAAATAAMTGGFAAAALAALPLILTIGAIVAALGILYVYWGDIQEFMTKSTAWVVDGFTAMMDGMKSLLKGYLKLVVWAVEGFVQMMLLPLTAAVEAAAAVLDHIPGMGSTASALKSISPGRIVHKYAGQIRGSIDAFEDGGTNIKGGAALVGESGPELVTLPPGSNVVTNENVNRLMGENKAGPSATPAMEQTLNITLELDGDVLARHQRKIAWNTMKSAFSMDIN